MAVNFNLQSILVKKEVELWLRDVTGRVTIHKFGKGQNEWGDRDYQKLARHWIQLVNFQVYQHVLRSQQVPMESKDFSVALEANYLTKNERQSLISAKVVDMFAVEKIPAIIEKLQKKVEEDQNRIKEKNLGFSPIFHIIRIKTSTPLTYLVSTVFCKIQGFLRSQSK
jgi:hypothetical protein